MSGGPTTPEPEDSGGSGANYPTEEERGQHQEQVYDTTLYVTGGDHGAAQQAANGTLN